MENRTIDCFVRQQRARFLFRDDFRDFALRSVEIAEGTALRGTGLDAGGIVSLLDPVNTEIALDHDPFGEILLGLLMRLARGIACLLERSFYFKTPTAKHLIRVCFATFFR